MMYQINDRNKYCIKNRNNIKKVKISTSFLLNQKVVVIIVYQKNVKTNKISIKNMSRLMRNPKSNLTRIVYFSFFLLYDLK
jgi:hypothetical protein